MKNTPTSGRASLPVKELSEDMRVAILEFLERFPGTSAEEIQQAIRVVEQGVTELPLP